MGEGEDGEEDKVRADPFLLIGGMQSEKAGQEGQEEEGGDGEGDGKEKQAAEGLEPGDGGGLGGGSVPDLGEAEEMAPGVEGHEVGAHAHERRGEGEKKEEKEGFAPLRPTRAGGQGQDERNEQRSLEEELRRSCPRIRGHELDDLPGLGGVEGEGGQHDPEAAAEAEGQPAWAGREKEGGVGGAPVPGGEEKKEDGGGEGGGFPDEEVKKGEGQIDDKEPKQKRDSGRFLLNPAGNPRVTGPMGNSKDNRGGQKKEGSEGKGLGGKDESKQSQ